MRIDANEKEQRAFDIYTQGRREEGMALEDSFVEDVRGSIEQGEDHCSCKKSCRWHGQCMECVAIHRAHRDHLPNCFHDMVNERIAAVSGLSEHSYHK